MPAQTNNDFAYSHSDVDDQSQTFLVRDSLQSIVWKYHAQSFCSKHSYNEKLGSTGMQVYKQLLIMPSTESQPLE